MPNADSAIRTVNRLCDILNAFNEATPALNLAELSRRVGLSKSTVYRLASALENQGLLLRDPQGLYHLGYQLIRWGSLAQSGLDLRNLALPELRALAAETHETAILSVRSGGAALWLEMIESPQPVRLALHVGQRTMLHAGASSKVLWAFLPPAEISILLEQIELTPLQPNTITDRVALQAELAAIRTQGYATSFEETDPGAMGVAAPVFDHTGRLVAGIGIAAPLTRVTVEQVPSIARQVMAAGRRLSQQLGAPATLPFYS